MTLSLFTTMIVQWQKQGNIRDHLTKHIVYLQNWSSTIETSQDFTNVPQIIANNDDCSQQPFLFNVVLGIQPKSYCMLGKHPATEPHPQPQSRLVGESFFINHWCSKEDNPWFKSALEPCPHPCSMFSVPRCQLLNDNRTLCPPVIVTARNVPGKW